MIAPPHQPYPDDPGPIGIARDGAAVALVPMTALAARDLGTRLAAIDPWARVDFAAEAFVAFLAAGEPAVSRYRVLVEDADAGVVVIRHRWLHGPYLHLLGLVPGMQGRGIGDVALAWFEAEARGAGLRNLWLCCSAFNTGARRFYEVHGFALAGVLASLVWDGQDELLMRKRLA